MIKVENIVTPSVEQWQAVIRGMRNPMNSWSMSDSRVDPNNPADIDIGQHDYDLMRRLSRSGSDHRKFLRMLPVWMDVTAPLYWWKEADTYKVGTAANSCSTMHKISAKEFDLNDFSHEHLSHNAMMALHTTIDALNMARDRYLSSKKKDDWWDIIQLLPSSYNQKRTWEANYEVLLNIYRGRKEHRLDEWREFCKIIEHDIPYFEEILL